jgi:hypothetical protein
MKAKPTLALLVALFLAGSSHCFALMEIAYVSPARAKELGITLRSRLNGDAGVAVWIEFKAVGELKNFTRVELRMTSGGKHFMSAPLQATRKADGAVEAYFSADPAQLAGSTFLIAVTDAPRTHIGYRLAVKDFAGAALPK